MGDHLRAALSQLRVEPTPKRIRCQVDGRTVVDTTAALLVWEPRRVVPVYAVPLRDLAAELVPESTTRPPDDLPPVLGPADYARHTTPGQTFTVRSGGRDLAGAAFRPDDEDLDGYVVLDFGAFGWLEEEEPVLGHPHDPFKRIDILAGSRHVTVSLDDLTLADSTRPVALFETKLPVRWYLPREDVRLDLLEESDTRTSCAYKGHATHYSLAGAGDRGRDLAWSYLDPLHEAAPVRDLVAFYSERCDVAVDDQAERPVTLWSPPEDRSGGVEFA
jgi:uncharacterized protein (DUF427 family)